MTLAPLDAGVDVPVFMHFEFQQFFETVEVSQTQFLYRLSDTPVATLGQVLTGQTVQKNRNSTVQSVAADCNDGYDCPDSAEISMK